MQSPESSVFLNIGGFHLHYYGLIMFFAIVTALFVMRFAAKKYYLEVKGETLLDVLPAVILSSIFGARLYYVLVDWDFYSKHLNEIIAVWNGGLSIHGGIIGGVVSGLILARIYKFSFLKYADVFSYGLVLGQAVGRFGNFFNAEAFGAPCSVPFLKLFIPLGKRPFGYEDIAYYHPTFLYEAVWDVLVFCVLFFAIRKLSKTPSGTIFFSYLILYSIGRFFIEMCRMDSVLNLHGIPIAQIVSVLIILGGTAGLVIINNKEKGKN